MSTFFSLQPQFYQIPIGIIYNIPLSDSTYRFIGMYLQLGDTVAGHKKEPLKMSGS
jgi:hypothetical protein